MKKKTKNILIGAGIVLAIVLIAYFGRNSYSITGVAGIQTANAGLILDTTDSATYNFNVAGTAPYTYGCTESTSESFDFVVGCRPSNQNAMPKLADNIQQDTYFPANDVTFEGRGAVYNSCSGSPQSANIVFDEKSAECKINAQGNSPDGSFTVGCVSCHFKGKVHAELNGQPVSAFIYGFSGVSTQVKIYKIGYPINPQCSVNSDCTQTGCFGNSCRNGICTENIITDLPPCEGATWDTSTCSWDKTNCVNPPEPNYLLIILGSLGIVLFVGLLVYILKKTGRKR